MNSYKFIENGSKDVVVKPMQDIDDLIFADFPIKKHSTK